MKQKDWLRIHIIQKLKFKSHENINIVFIRSLLEYGNIIWDNCIAYEKNNYKRTKMKLRESQLVQ